jgi:hypothetical protein
MKAKASGGNTCNPVGELLSRNEIVSQKLLLILEISMGCDKIEFKKV